MKNKVIIKGDIAEIHVDSRKHGHKIVLIDAIDLPLLADVVSVYVSDIKASHGMKPYVYAFVRIDGKSIQLHRFLMSKFNEIEGKLIDHKNHNRLDDRRSCNLRIGDRYLNSQNRNGLDRNNSSGVRGVYWDNERNKWRVQIDANGKRYRLGRYETIEEAAEVANKAREELHIV